MKKYKTILSCVPTLVILSLSIVFYELGLFKHFLFCLPLSVMLGIGVGINFFCEHIDERLTLLETKLANAKGIECNLPEDKIIISPPIFLLCISMLVVLIAVLLAINNQGKLLLIALTLISIFGVGVHIENRRRYFVRRIENIIIKSQNNES